MSWTLDGHYYSSYEAYQRALQQRDLGSARAQIHALSQQAERQQAHARETERRLREAQGNLELQTRFNEELQGHVEDLHRTQQRLRSAHDALERQMQNGFNELQEDLAATNHNVQQLGCEQAKTRANLATLKSQHETHVAEVRAEFNRAEENLAKGLAEAEQRRAATEKALREEVAKVDAKVEADREARRVKAKSAAEEAAGLAEVANSILMRLTPRQEELSLADDIRSLREGLQQIQHLLKQQNTSAALGVSATFFTNTVSLEKKARERDAALNAARVSVRETVQQLQQMLADANVREYFPGEAKAAAATLEYVQERAAKGYANFDQMKQNAPAVREALTEIEHEVLVISAGAPQAKELYAAREERVDELLNSLRQELGPMSVPDVEYADTSNPKSALVVKCEIGGQKLALHVPLEPRGKLQIESWGHQTNTDCKTTGVATARRLAQHLQMTAVQTDAERRLAPKTKELADHAPWAGLADRLTRIRSRL